MPLWLREKLGVDMEEKTISMRKNIVYGLISLVVSTIILILAAKSVGRFIVYMKYGVSGKSYGLWQYDAELGAIHASNAYNSNSETNNLGFRNREDVFRPKPRGALRIIAYGGSTTFCFNLYTDQAWPIRLQIFYVHAEIPKIKFLTPVP